MNKLISTTLLASFLAVTTSHSNVPDSANAQPFARPRPDLNGFLVRNPVNGMIFWVDRGQRRHILNPSVYQRLFVSNHRDYLDTEAIQLGASINGNNRLVRCGEQGNRLSGRVYLLDQGTKRHITSPTAMKKNNFNWNGISNVDCPVLDTITNGSPIN
ncbi:hypothetical protein NDI37_15090 [Funiculus sociatus GB2-A5]|uniref:Uncharacterized protein n=1 Tax=Funiculus sociatus GB2-A5 TaxID=2933946 RepID=A0ABV0JQY7_9CYAN|nr:MULTISPECIES: hypothetical protein [unclassified Trichocoleus]MBD1908138.1 hypothetical protein [Trichocoleus sp. FACHB-832]MBD2062031.1 hypothetical protein [Trichocoleus sp. FACHB-6]